MTMHDEMEDICRMGIRYYMDNYLTRVVAAFVTGLELADFYVSETLTLLSSAVSPNFARPFGRFFPLTALGSIPFLLN